MRYQKNTKLAISVYILFNKILVVFLIIHKKQFILEFASPILLIKCNFIYYINKNLYSNFRTILKELLARLPLISYQFSGNETEKIILLLSPIRFEKSLFLK